MMALVAEVASAAQRKTAYHAPSLALTGSRPPVGDYPVVCASGYLLPSMPSTSARVYHGNAGWRSLPAIRKALGAVEGLRRGLMTGASPALPETQARNGAQPLAARTNYKYHPTKVIKKSKQKSI